MKKKNKENLYNLLTKITAYVGWLFSLCLIVSFLTYSAKDPSINSVGADKVNNLLGVFGSYISDFFIVSIGLSAFLIPVFLSALAYKFYKHKRVSFLKTKFICFMLSAIFLSVSIAKIPAFYNYDLVGGFLGASALSEISDAMNGFPQMIISYIAGVLSFIFVLVAVGFTPSEYYAFFKMVYKHIILLGDAILAMLKPFLLAMAKVIFKKKKPVAPTKKKSKPRVAKAAPKVKKGKKEDAEKKPSLNFEMSLKDMDIIPPISLLDMPKNANKHLDVPVESLQNNASVLMQILNDYGVKGEIVDIKPGPVVTLYELEPAAGIKASRVIALADDVALKMSAISVRVALIPGRNVIGIEIPNDNRETVYLKELVSSHKYETAKMKLPLILGKDISGSLILGDLAKMPHLLVAGTTGSGKSVAVNTMILSLIYKMPPEKCRLIMVDPKMLELSVYDDIPHLLTPVVTDSKKAVVALKWAVHEMEDRYRAMSKLGVRNLEGYNKRIKEAIDRGEVITNEIQTGFDSETGKPVFERQPIELKELPYIVIIVDEFADLMMVAGKEIDACIQRLAQMARAAGIHMIMATQRPSVDVVTGTIKANFPSRISFAVSSKIDSRTILGEGGAEQLLGMGDMLYMESGRKAKRVHGPFVGDKEVERVVKFLKDKSDPNYIDSVTKDDENEDISYFGAGAIGGNTSAVDALYDRAVQIVIEDQKASISYVQRKLSIGYNRAAKIVEEMEAQGVISPANRTGRREVLAK
ncbi:MAG: DNA translocase FtsK 4TM domain-containing protein [Alphaproteobacteria bacterium]|nr:DNA translocase FtsK 4TM domain-containing protein [Alphaproteobacteria bacterium]